jgi:tetratricopeptide (TPR) repeat protein
MNKQFENAVKLYHSHRFDEALRELQEVEKDVASSPELDYYIGLTLTQLGRYEDALLSLEKVVTSHFSFLHITQARMVLGYIYAITGRYRLAEFEFLKVVDIGLQSSQALAALGYVLYSQKKIPQSIEALKKALSIDAKNPNALNSLGFIFAEERTNLPEAVSLCRQAVEMNPKNPAYLDSLGWALFRSGEHMEARGCFRRALDLSPGNKEIASHMKQLMEETRTQ